MKAVRIHNYGGPEQLRYEDAPTPQLGIGDVLVRVRAAGVNPVDWKVRQGHLRERLRHRLPLTLGWDFSGVVERLGEGAEGVRVGDEVFARPDIARDGAYAELIAVRASEVAAKPRTLDHVHAASIPLAALTAWEAVIVAGGLQPGQTVLIHAGAGGVGSFAIQLARWKGARILTTASAANADFVRGLGANESIDYRAQRFEDLAEDVDLVIDTMGGDTQRRSWATLKRGGTLVSTVQPPDQEEARRRGGIATAIFISPDKERLTAIARLVDDGVVRTTVSETLPLGEARRAQELSETGHVRGKIVLRVE